MKLELDLSDIYENEDEYVIQPDLLDRIVVRVADDIRRSIKDKFKKDLDEALQKVIEETVKSEIQTLTINLLDREFTVTTDYGRKEETTTVRNKIIKQFEVCCTYEPKHWSSEENVFTKAVKSVFDKKIGEFQSLFNKTVDAQMVKESMEYATKKFTDRFGLK